MATTDKQNEINELLEKRQYWWWAEKARSPRIDYLRKAVWSKVFTFQGSKWMNMAPYYTPRYLKNQKQSQSHIPFHMPKPLKM